MMSHTRFLLILILILFPCRLQGYENWFERGMTSLETRRLKDAIDAFSLTIEIIPHDFEAYNNRGVAWFLKGEHTKAMEDFNEALAINPRLAQAYCNRGIVWFHKGKFDFAIEDSSGALEINPRFFQAYSTRGAAWTQKGAYIEAIRDYEKAQKLDPGDSQTDSTKGGSQRYVATPVKFQYPNAIVLRMLHREIMAAGFSKYIAKLKSLARNMPPRTEDAVPPRRVAAAEPVKPVARKVKKRLASGGKGKIKTDSRPPADTPSKEKKQTPKPVEKQTVAVSANIKRITPTTYPYTVLVSSFKNPRNAYRVARGLRKKGHAAFTSPAQIPARGVWYRVLIGHFVTRKKALVRAKELKQREFRDTLAMRLGYALHVDAADLASDPNGLNSAFGSKGYLPYTISTGVENETAPVLMGAFQTRKQAHAFAEKLSSEGLKVRVVRR